MDEAKKCMKWICNYIEFQANKPAPFHVRDLHSIIVAAFNCLSQWILNHHWLLNDDVSHVKFALPFLICRLKYCFLN